MSIHKYKKSNTTYYYVKYKNTTKRGFKTKREASLYESKLKLTEFKTGSFPFMYDLILDYLEHYKTIVAYGTYKKANTVIENIIKPNIKNKTIDMYNELECRKFRDYVAGLDYSTRHKNCIITTYKALFKHAEKYFGLKNNPSTVIEPFKKTFEEKLDKKNKEMNIWTVEDFNKFIVHVDRKEYKPLFIILYFTGLRLGEALALQWKDFNNGKLHIDKSITTKTTQVAFEVKDTKNTSSIRDVVLGEYLTNYLISLKENEMRKNGFSDEWFIFGRLAPLPSTSIHRVKDRAIEKAGVRRIRIHDFRHSHASNLIGDGINIVAVSRRLGHSDINMTLKVYTHLLQKNEDELAQYLNQTSQNILI